jgi:hypothetical protein
MYGLGVNKLGAVSQSLSPVVGAEIIDIASLFTGLGDTGCFYDLNDLSTLKEDIAGTTAASIDNPVGKILDKGTDADMVALTDLGRGTLKRKPKDTPRRNRAARTETTAVFSSVANVTQTIGTETSPLSYQSRNVHTLTVTGSGNQLAYGALPAPSITGTNQTISFYAKISSTGSTPCEGIYLLNNQSNVGSVLFDFDNETVTGTNGDLVSGSITAVANHTGWYKCVATVPVHGDVYFFLLTDGTSNFANGVSPNNVVKIQGYQRETGNTATDYQAVYVNSYEEYGITNVNYIRLTASNYATQDFDHDSQNLVMFSRADDISSSSGDRCIFSSSENTSNQSYRLLSTGSNFKFEVGATGGNSAQVAIPSGISTVRAEYIAVSDTGKIYVNGTLGQTNNTLNSQATDFNLFNEASLGAQISQNGNPPAVSNKFSGNLYSFVLFTRTLTDTEKQNIEHTLKEQTGVQ